MEVPGPELQNQSPFSMLCRCRRYLRTLDRPLAGVHWTCGTSLFPVEHLCNLIGHLLKEPVQWVQEGLLFTQEMEFPLPFRLPFTDMFQEDIMFFAALLFRKWGRPFQKMLRVCWSFNKKAGSWDALLVIFFFSSRLALVTVARDWNVLTWRVLFPHSPLLWGADHRVKTIGEKKV